MRIDLTIKEIKRITNGELVFKNNTSSIDSLDYTFLIQNITSLENATEKDLAILYDRGDSSVFDQLSIDVIKNSKAGLIITQKEFIQKNTTLDKNYILVDNTLIAINQILDFLNQTDFLNTAETNTKTTFVHSTAQFGENTKIGAQVFIGKNVKIGENTKIYPNVTILDGTIIGNNCIIHSGTIIGSDGFGYQVTKSGLQKIPQLGIVNIGNYVEIGSNCSIDKATFDQTYIGDGVKIDNLVHIAHNVTIGAHTVILAQTGIAGGAVIGVGCQIGGQVAIKDHVKIGNSVKIVSKSGVMKDIKDGEVVAGIPAINFSDWKRLSVAITKLPELLKDFIKIKDLAQKVQTKKFSWFKFWGK